MGTITHLADYQAQRHTPIPSWVTGPLTPAQLLFIQLGNEQYAMQQAATS
jgi:hypothetical protein